VAIKILAITQRTRRRHKASQSIFFTYYPYILGNNDLYKGGLGDSYCFGAFVAIKIIGYYAKEHKEDTKFHKGFFLDIVFASIGNYNLNIGGPW